MYSRNLIIASAIMFLLRAAPPSAAQEIPASDPTTRTHSRYSPFWTNIEACRTDIHLHNNVIAEPLTVLPILHLETGQPIQLPPVTLPPQGSSTIQVNDVMREFGLTADHFGGAEFRYQRQTGGALSVETHVVMASKNLAYSIPSYTVDDWRSQEQHAVFWLPGRDSEVYVAMHNISARTVAVRPVVRLAGQSFPAPELELAPHGFAKFRVPAELLDSQSFIALIGRPGSVGSINLLHDGPAGALHTTGWIDDDEFGFSTMLSFTDPVVARGNRLFGTQIWDGEQRDLLGPGRSLTVASHILLHNMSDTIVRSSAQFMYNEGNVVVSAPLRIGNVRAGDTVHIDLGKLKQQRVIPGWVTEGSIIVEHSGSPGALMGRIFGISDDNTYGFYSILEDHASGSKSGVYWSIIGDTNSVFTITNLSDEADVANLELTYNGGSFRLPGISLQSNESKTINLRKWLADHSFDESGDRFPIGVVEGGYRLQSSNPVLGRLIIKEHLLSESARISTPFYGTCDFVDYLFWGSGTASSVNIGNTAQVYPYCAWNYGNQPAPGGTAWSSNTSIATVGFSAGSWRVTGLQAGTANVTFGGDYPMVPACQLNWFQTPTLSVTVRAPHHVSFNFEISKTINPAAICGSVQGVERWVSLQLKDQLNQNYQVGGLTMRDTISVQGSNPHGVSGAHTGSTNTSLAGSWADQYFLCSTACPTAAQTNALQTWTWNWVPLPVSNTIVYKCTSITIDGN